ncbi:MAG: DUF4232 domain-containing protein [Nocardioidaceae bacterium]
MRTLSRSLSLTASLVLTAGFTALAAPAAEAHGTTECGNADLAAHYRYSDSGAGHVHGWIVLRNVSVHACATRGFGGLSYVGDGDGTQIGAPADRDGSAVRVVLKPGHRVRSLVDETRAQNYPRKHCHRAHVDGFRVYVPDATASQYVVHPTTGCRNDAVHLLGHRAYRRP